LSDTEKLYDVVQIGYGPVGQANAAMFGKLGYDVSVFERHPTLFGLSRAGHIDHEIMRVLQLLGCSSAMEAESVSPEMYEWRGAKGQTLLQFPWLNGISGWRAAYLFYQPVLETALDAAVRRYPNVEVSQGWEAVALKQESDHVAVTLQKRQATAGAPEQRTVRGKYLVAADGGSSFVREAAGLEMRNLGYRHGWLVLDFLYKRPVKLEWDNGQICDPDRPTSMFEMGKHHRRFSFAAMPGETEEMLLRPETAWDLVKPWVTPDDVELIRQIFYVFEAKVLDDMRHDRIFFVGDSAHVMPPFLGQGMGSGIRDALNLSWKLDLVLRGRADDALLDTYSPERQPHSERYAELSMELARLLCMTDPEEAARRDESILGGTMPPLKPFPWIEKGVLQSDPPAEIAAVAGRLSPQGVISFEGRRGRGDDVIGTGWQLISRHDLKPSCDARSLEILDELSFRFLHFGEGGAVDTDGAYTRFLDDKGLDAVVIRPDFYVFGGTVEGGDINQVLAQLGEQLHLRLQTAR
jgi:2-polyprenyl-6-methoxyphenol hydroxylase-like FAD-dependent oxidoreductase